MFWLESRGIRPVRRLRERHGERRDVVAGNVGQANARSAFFFVLCALVHGISPKHCRTGVVEVAVELVDEVWVFVKLLCGRLLLTAREMWIG